MEFVDNIVSRLRQRGYKLTPQRQAILDVISPSREHLTPAAIHERVHTKYPGIGLVTIYRTLELLARLGLICEVHTGDSRRSYLLRRPAGHHHHLICSYCDTVVDFADCDVSELENKLSQKTGFEIESHILEFSGRCQNCQEAFK